MCSKPLVLDFGSYLSKVGFSGDDFPVHCFPTVIGKSLNEDDILKGGIPVGEAAINHRNHQAIRYPIEFGFVTNWDNMDPIFCHTFESVLRVPPDEHCVLLTETTTGVRYHREKAAQIIFEKFGVQGLYIALQAVLSLYAYGRTFGTVVDCGAGHTMVIPVYEGYSIPHALVKTEFSGRTVTAYLTDMRPEIEFLDTFEKFQTFRDIKERYGYVSLDYECELKKTIPPIQYELPDGNVISLGSERFKCGEVLFRPHLVGIEMEGLPEMTMRSVNRCDKELRKELYENIFLSGGGSMFPGLVERLQRDIINITPENTRIHVGKPIGNLSAWIGGSILSSLSSFKDMWISQEEYDEHGPAIVTRKCFS